jgi:hypothetical protein
MNTIEVLGSGCAKCQKLHDLVKQVTTDLGLEIPVGYSSDVQKIVALGLMQSPVLLINSKPVLIGTIPNPTQLQKIIQDNLLAE